MPDDFEFHKNTRVKPLYDNNVLKPEKKHVCILKTTGISHLTTAFHHV